MSDDPIAHLRAVRERLRFIEMARQEARRTIVCPDPDTAVHLAATVAALGVDDVYTVTSSSLTPPGTVIVIDEQAIEASFREVMNRPLRF